MHPDKSRANKVKALPIGTPYWGAVKAYNAIIDGYTFGNDAMDKKAVKVLGQNAPAPYELLPRSPFIIDARTKETVLIADSLGDIRYRPVRPDGTENISVDTGLNPTVLDIANQFWYPAESSCGQ